MGIFTDDIDDLNAEIQILKAENAVLESELTRIRGLLHYGVLGGRCACCGGVDEHTSTCELGKEV